jgi:hypothetical protein
MKNISKEDFIIWDSINQWTVESLDIVYHFTTVIDLINDGFKLRQGHIWICVASLPLQIQEKISQAIEKTK